MRNVCFTAWADVEYNEEYMSYLVSGEEICPETKKLHFQGYCELKRPTDFSVVKRLLGETTHLAKRESKTPRPASDYCKKDKKFKEYGTMSRQGKRTDLDDVIEDVQNGTDIRTIAMGHPVQYIKFHRGIEKLRNFYIEPRSWTTTTTVLWGSTGTGKSKMAREMCEGNKYWVWMPQRGNWFDGYDGQSYCIFEEFEGQLDYKTLLTLTDRYECPCPVKGGFIEFAPKTIIFTSSKPVEHWYPGTDISELLRRITDFGGAMINLNNGTEGTEVVEGNTGLHLRPEEDLL